MCFLEAVNCYKLLYFYSRVFLYTECIESIQKWILIISLALQVWNSRDNSLFKVGCSLFCHQVVDTLGPYVFTKYTATATRVCLNAHYNWAAATSLPVSCYYLNRSLPFSITTTADKSFLYPSECKRTGCVESSIVWHSMYYCEHGGVDPMGLKPGP